MSNETPKIVVVDLDGTLLLEGGGVYGGEERINYEVQEALKKDREAGYRIFILTGRKSRDHYEDTLNTLWYYNIRYQHLYMQEGGVGLENHIFKKQILEELQKDYKIMNVYDDNPAIGVVCEEIGIPFYLVKS